MPAAPPVISVTLSVGPFKSEDKMLNAFGDVIAAVIARAFSSEYLITVL